MASTARKTGEVVEYDEAEINRRMGQVYSLLLDASQQKRAAREAQQAAVSQDTLAGGEAMT